MFSADDFGGHPIGCADQSVSLFVALNIGAKPEIGDLHSAVDPQQNVVRLDVSVQNTLLVQIRNTLQNLSAKK